ncbi:MAG: magnesium transporter MgtE [Selenomonadaceae bacterium]|nr:magnesium transporter MgtE [Selenomonadaceae bacterium]
MANTEAVPSRKRILLKRAGMGLLLVVLVVGGFFLGIYLKILDGDEMNKKLGLYDMPIIGQYFVRPTPEDGSTVPDSASEQAKLEQERAKKAAEEKKSKPVKLTKEEIEKLTQQRQAEEKKRVSKLARLYNEMKPEEAAKIMENMESDIVIAIFQRMDESQVSQIMASFDAGKAASISKLMYVGVPKRVQQVTVDGQLPQQMQ